MVTIRAARPEDAAAIAVIWNRIITETTVTFTSQEKSVDILAEKLTSGCWKVAEDPNGAVIGFATHGPFRGGPGYARSAELTLYLAPTATGQRLGPRLLAALEESAREEGIHVLIAGVSSANPDAVRFFQRENYAQVGRLRDVGFKFNRYLDLILLQKILRGGRNTHGSARAG